MTTMVTITLVTEIDIEIDIGTTNMILVIEVMEVEMD
jgi:hypothetical protein